MVDQGVCKHEVPGLNPTAGGAAGVKTHQINMWIMFCCGET